MLRLNKPNLLQSTEVMLCGPPSERSLPHPEVRANQPLDETIYASINSMKQCRLFYDKGMVKWLKDTAIDESQFPKVKTWKQPRGPAEFFAASDYYKATISRVSPVTAPLSTKHVEMPPQHTMP